jgi:hypothetical protein
MPQPPQLLLSVCVSRHWPLQNCVGAVQTSVHEPFVQTSSFAHVVPHVPQFASSVSTSVQVEPHRSGAVPPHTGLHVPATQFGVAPLHWVPQVPQLVSSVWVSTQVLLQSTCGCVQLTVPWHVPVLPFGVHDWPIAQVVPQPPQFASSERGSMHVLLQLISGNEQAVVPWHVPVPPFGVQVCESAHVLPQLPQFASSVVGSMQTLLHAICGGVHVTLFWH